MPHGKFEFQGTGGSYFWLMIWTSILTALTLGLFWPWAYSIQQRWIAERTFIDGKQLMFNGSGVSFFGNWLLCNMRHKSRRPSWPLKTRISLFLLVS